MDIEALIHAQILVAERYQRGDPNITDEEAEEALRLLAGELGGPSVEEHSDDACECEDGESEEDFEEEDAPASSAGHAFHGCNFHAPVHFSEGDWTPYEGPRGGKGWKRGEEIVYGDKPGTAGGGGTEGGSASGKRAQDAPRPSPNPVEVAQRLHGRIKATAWQLARLAAEYGPDVFEVAEDTWKITFAKHADSLREHTGIGTGVLLNVASHVIGRALVWAKRKLAAKAQVQTHAEPRTGRLAALLAELMGHLFDELGMPAPDGLEADMATMLEKHPPAGDRLEKHDEEFERKVKRDHGKFAKKAGAKGEKKESSGANKKGGDAPAKQPAAPAPAGVPDHHPGAVHGSSVRVTPVKERVFSGKPVQTQKTLTKQETGRVGEAVITAWLKHLGRADAGPMNAGQTNFPIDLIEDHAPTEAKGGLVSNSVSAQQWRLTFSKETASEKEMYEKMTAEERSAWNLDKQQRIHERKEAVVQALSERFGVEVKPRTMTAIINPDTQTADIYAFDGFHDRIGWNSDMARAGYVGTVRYDHPE